MKRARTDDYDAEREAEYFAHHCARPGCDHKEGEHAGFIGKCLVTNCQCPAFIEKVVAL